MPNCVTKHLVFAPLLFFVCSTASADELKKGSLVVSTQDQRISEPNKQPHEITAGQEMIVVKTDKDQLLVDTGDAKGWIGLALVKLSDKKPKQVSFTINYRIFPGASTSRVQFKTNLPKNIPGRQTIRELNCSITPKKVFSKDDTDYALFDFRDPTKPIEIKIDVEADIYRYDLETAKRGNKPTLANPSDLQRWLKSERFLEKDADEIKAAAEQIPDVSSDKAALTAARNIMRYVQQTLDKSTFQTKQLGAIGALKDKRGDCTEFSDLFVVLCRAKGIPARNCDGYLMIQPKKNDTVRHKWAEFYCPQYGWVPVDPIQVELGFTTFERMNNSYVYASRLRNDPTIGNFEFSQYTYWGDAIRMEDEVVVHE